MPTVTVQPEADSYYAEGYWRDGDLWSDFARRAEENPDKPALILDDRVFTFDQLRRAAVGISVRLADGGVQPGDVVILLGRHSIEAAVAMLGCMHRGVVIAPLPSVSRSPIRCRCFSRSTPTSSTASPTRILAPGTRPVTATTSRWCCTRRARPRRRRASPTPTTRCATQPRAFAGAGS